MSRPFYYHSLPLPCEMNCVFIGDLTDAKAKDQVTSYQHKSEWQTYKRTRDECYSRAAAAQEKSYVDGSRKNLAPWIDIRGNHGNK